MSTLKKCIIWDLDNTLWNGVCLEGPVTLRRDVIATIAVLDRRGILHSIASRGDTEVATATLREFGVDSYFLVPRINWLPKSQNISDIMNDLGIAGDAVAFIDDDPFECEQVAFMLPDVLTIPSEDAGTLASRAEFSPDHVTHEASQRRQYYQSELQRKAAEHQCASREEFLRSCNMRLSIRPMTEEDIPRVMELMTRTHQMNTTGLMLDEPALEQLLHDPQRNRQISVGELTDKFGEYGIVATAMIDTKPLLWRLEYLAVSCRVMGRGIERALLASLADDAVRDNGMVIEATYRETGRNRMMRAFYQMMGFREYSRGDDANTIVFRASPQELGGIPRWLEVT
jgi:FkbH-like protein